MTKSAKFRQGDLSRALKAVRDSGMDVTETRVLPDGTIVIRHTPPENEQKPSVPDATEWDDLLVG